MSEITRILLIYTQDSSNDTQTCIALARCESHRVQVLLVMVALGLFSGGFRGNGDTMNSILNCKPMGAAEWMLYITSHLFHFGSLVTE